MSFSENLKKELLALPRKLTCCKKAFCAGLLAGSAYSDDGTVTFETELYELMEDAKTAFRESFGREAEIIEKSRVGHTRYVMSFISRSASQMLGQFESPVDNADAEKAVGFRCESCRVHFLRGAFLSLATVSDPMKSYHLEFLVKEAGRAKLLYKELQKAGFTPKIASRRDKIGLYFKESETIEDMLTYLGASKMLFECFNDKILRDLRNDANRRSNCETGNIAKAVGASQDVIAAIRRLEAEGRLASLPDELRETARVRLEHPEASLSELCGYFSPPLSKSGLNHRFSKIKSALDD